MKRFLSLLFLFSVLSVSVIPAHAQSASSEERLLKGVMFGGNYTQINYLNKRRAPAFRPFIGFVGDYNLSKKWIVGGAANYFFKASNLNSLVSIEQQGIDLFLYSALKIEDLSLKGGFNLDNTLVSFLRSKGNDNGISNLEKPKAQSLLNYFVGIEFKLNEELEFFVNQSISSNANNGTNSMVGLRYNLNQRRTTLSRRKRRRISSAKHISNLKDGVLLVRLKTSQPTIDAMRYMGMDKEAKRVELIQKRQNKALVKAFRTYYSFSEVQFFYSNFSKKVKEGQLEGIFLNDSLELDSSISIPVKQKVYTAEFANIEQDSAKFFSHYSFVPDGPFKQKKVERFYGAPDMDFKAIVIKNRQFEQLSAPFPYYSRYIGASLKKHPEEGLILFPLVHYLAVSSFSSCVMRLDKRLNRFHKSPIKQKLGE